MRVAFVIPAAPPDCYGRHRLFVDEKRPFIGIAYLAAVLRQSGAEVEVYDRHLLGTTPQCEPRWESFDVAAFYASVAMLQDLDHLLSRASGKLRCVVGGPHASLDPHRWAGVVDTVVVGEGEKVIVDVATGRTQTEVIVPPPLDDLDSLPRAAFDLFASLPYTWSGGWVTRTDKPPPSWLAGQSVWNLNTSRGCPCRCTFCTVPEIWGWRYRCQSAERILDDMLYLRSEFGASAIYFREDNFFGRPSRVIRLCDLLLQRSVNMPWICEARSEALQDATILRHMRHAGCVGVYIGAESGSDHILRRIGKGVTSRQTRTAVRNAKDAGIKVALSLMHGFPFETATDASLTDAMLSECEPDCVWRNHYLGVPTSKLYGEIRDSGDYLYEDALGILHIEPLDYSDRSSRKPMVFLTTPEGDNNHPWPRRMRHELGKVSHLLFKPSAAKPTALSCPKSKVRSLAEPMRIVVQQRSRTAEAIRMTQLTKTLEALPDGTVRVQFYTNTTLPPEACDVIYTDVFLSLMMSLRDRIPGYEWPPDLASDAVQREAELVASAKRVWTTSKWVARWGQENFEAGERIRYVGVGPSLVPPPVVSRLPKHRRVLFVGKDGVRKGLDLLLEAMQLVRCEHPDAELVAVTTHQGPPTAGVIWHDPVDSQTAQGARTLSRLFSSCWVFTMPTRFDPVGIAFLDAMAHGRAVVGPSEFMVPEFLQDSVSGGFCELDPASIAKAIGFCLRDRDVCEAMGQEARRLQSGEFSWGAVVSRMAEDLAVLGDTL